MLERDYTAYDGNGNLLQVTELLNGTSSTADYSYYDDDRLAAATGRFGSRGYTYSANGHRQSLDQDGELLEYSYSGESLYRVGHHPGTGESGEIVSPATPYVAEYTSDILGNITDKLITHYDCVAVTGDGTTTTDPTTEEPTPIGGTDQYDCTITAQNDWHYAYSPLNRLQSVTRNGALVASYRYNSRGQRVAKTLADGTVTRYVYGRDGRLLAELDGYGGVRREYLYLDATPIALRDFSDGTGVPKTYFIHSDHLGTPKAMTDMNGAVVWTATHTPFGAATVAADADGDGSPVTLNLRFPGQYHDAETGLHYNYHRYYEPATGRYLTSDPIGLEGGFNIYAYAKNNSIKFTDRYGLAPTEGAGRTGNPISEPPGGAKIPNPKVPPFQKALRGGLKHIIDTVTAGTVKLEKKTGIIKHGSRALILFRGILYTEDLGCSSLDCNNDGALDEPIKPVDEDCK